MPLSAHITLYCGTFQKMRCRRHTTLDFQDVFIQILAGLGHWPCSFNQQCDNACFTGLALYEKKNHTSIVWASQGCLAALLTPLKIAKVIMLKFLVTML